MSLSQSYGGCFFRQALLERSPRATNKGRRKKRAEKWMKQVKRWVRKSRRPASTWMTLLLQPKIKGDILKDPLLKVLQINVTTNKRHRDAWLASLIPSKVSTGR